MITKEQFTKIINTVISYNKELDRWDDFGIEIYNLPLGEYSALLSELTYTNLFNDEGIDCINWWLYEKPALFESEPDKEIFDENGNIIPTTTIDDLWNIVKEHRK